MDTQKLIDFIPAVLLLISIMTIILVIITKFGNKIFDNDYKADNVLIFVASFLFIVILITHLFREQTWTADTLKVIIGVLIGAGSSKLTKSKEGKDKAMELSGNEIKDSIVNQAMRDINQKIDHFNSELSKFENAIVNQHNDNNAKTLITRPERFRLETDDTIFLSRLKDIQNSYDDWTWKWMEECIKYPEFNRRLKDKIDEVENDGWTVASMNFDNTSKGIHINMELEKPYEQ